MASALKYRPLLSRHRQNTSNNSDKLPNVIASICIFKKLCENELERGSRYPLAAGRKMGLCDWIGRVPGTRWHEGVLEPRESEELLMKH